MDQKTTPPSDRTRLRRAHERGRHDRRTICDILDAATVCHVGYVIGGKPAVTPTLHWRQGDRVYWHGSSASRGLRASRNCPVCLTVTHLDGLVLARSAFHHSANYRSVMVYGRADPVDDADEKRASLRAFVDKILPGRWEQLRPMTDREVKATMVLSMPIDEASAKIRDGGPKDDEDDYALPIWAGVIPIRTIACPPVADTLNLKGLVQAEHVRSFRLD